MSELAKRTASGVVLGAAVLGALWTGSWWYAALLLLGAVLLFREFAQLVWRMSSVPASRLAWLLFGAAYIGLAVYGLWRVRAVAPGGLLFAIWLYLIVWATDIGAYAFGRVLGGPKILPAISPSKTWAGLLGAIVFVALVMNAMWAVASRSVHDGMVNILVLGLLWGAPLAVLAQAGDFFESWMKRKAGVKDSGRLIPGHGGLFDRVDGLLPVAIVFHPWLKALTW